MKTENWSVRELTCKVDNKNIIKPAFQRKRKWDVQMRKQTVPNEKDYIEFLYTVRNSVHVITFGQSFKDCEMTFENIDGNNRINAIYHYMKTPFAIFPEYLDDLRQFIMEIPDLKEEEKQSIVGLFESISYSEMFDFSTVREFFNNTRFRQLYADKLHVHSDDFGDHIREARKRISVQGHDFGSEVTINVNVFQGYSIEELCQLYEDMNVYNSLMTQMEILASRLYKVTDFAIKDNIMERRIINAIIKYYDQSGEDEVLSCHKFNDTDQMNAYQFIVGFQIYCHGKYDNVRSIDNKQLCLFFKLYSMMYGEWSRKTFTTENVNHFISNMTYSCDALAKIYKDIFTEQINSRLFNKACEKKIKSIGINNMHMIISAVVGYKKKNISETVYGPLIERALLYFFFMNEVRDDEKKEKYRLKSKFRALGACNANRVDDLVKRVYDAPDSLSSDITRTLMEELITDLISESNVPYARLLDSEKKKNNKRRYRKFFEKCLLFYCYKQKVPTNFLNNKFSFEHIHPFSCMWEGEIDIDRLGNIIPIIEGINTRRGNKSISEYKKLDVEYGFMQHISDFIQKEEVYDTYVHHETPKATPKITNNEKYNSFCEQNETKYMNVFLDRLFR
jgi:hypothetical protein